MKLTAKVKLLPSPPQAEALRRTLETANAACNYISEQAWQQKTFRQYPLHHLTYHQVRQRFPLTAQVVVRCLSKVADAYKLDRKTKRTFSQHGAIAFDRRILTWKIRGACVSIWTLEGRQQIPFTTSERHRKLLETQRGETDLCLISGRFYLFTTCEVQAPEPRDVDDVLGVDLGIVNLATDSDGTVYSGQALEHRRRTYAHRRRNLQRKRTKAARRKLKKLSGRQARYQKHVNHQISKAIVANAEGTGRGIALEDLTGMRTRITARQRQRARLANWGFAQLRGFIEYKAALAGILVVWVDPKYTSTTCVKCGFASKLNRRSQHLFICHWCGFSAPADVNAARNIRARAAIDQPMVSTFH